MPFADTFSFFITVLALAIAPGPVVLMLMVRAASGDAKAAGCAGLGYALGGVLIISTVCFGLSAYLSAVPEIFEYSKYVMLAYFLYLAHGIWKGGFDLNADCEARKGGLLSAVGVGLGTCMISPYMMVLFPLVLPEMMDVSAIEMPDFLILALTTFAGILIAAGLVVVFAAQLRRIARSPRSMMVMNRTLASVLVLSGGWMAIG